MFFRRTNKLVNRFYLNVNRNRNNKGYRRIISSKVPNNHLSTVVASVDQIKTDDNNRTGKLFEAISDLSSFGIQLEHFPAVVMVGPQSSGKTSVLEAICGRNFMPKKMDMATMKPFHVTTIKSDRLSFKIRDQEITSEREAMELVSRLNANENVKIIDIKIFAPDLYNCFLIDLPGLFYVSKTDKSLPKKIRELINSYLRNKNNIPCVVSTANQDPKTNQAIQLVSDNNREADAIGVITKVDLAVERQDVSGILRMIKNEPSDYALGYGWVAVVLKNTSDNNKRMTVAEKLAEEKIFFEKYNEFQPAGVEIMRERISRIQFDQIKENIPRILTEIDNSIHDLTSSGTFNCV